MSATVLRTFLPESVAGAERQPLLRYILTVLYPKYIEELCSVPVIHLQGDTALRWPTVAAASFCGCLLGFLTSGHMLRRIVTRSRRERGFFSWGFAFLWYAIMCLGGFFHHCISPSPFFYTTDIIGTACSSISIVAGSILADDTSDATRIFLLAIYGFLIFLAVSGSQAVREVLYLGPMVLCIVPAAWFLWKVNTEAAARQTSAAVRKRIWKWSAVAVVGAVMAVGGVAGDKWLCLLFGSNFGMMFWAFLGCNIALFAFFPIVLLFAPPKQGGNPNLKRS